MVKVGIPRTLDYYWYYPFWQLFFRELGLEVVISNKTNKTILKDGIAVTISEVCLPIKLFHGHIIDLIKRGIDYLFLPRYVHIEKRFTFCPKILGLPDMVRSSIKNLPKVIEARIDLKLGSKAIFNTLMDIGSVFVNNKRILRRVSKNTLRSFACSTNYANWDYPLKDGFKNRQGNYRFRIALLGYPYLLYDAYVNLNLIRHLHDESVEVVTPETLPEEVIRRQVCRLPKKMFWTLSNRIMGAAFYYLNQKDIDGLILLSSFGCGPDAMVSKLIELETKKLQVPFLTLILDEHTAEGGMLTRLHAFIDMLARKEKVRCP